MPSLVGKKIHLGVCGGIAAYKSAILASLLKKSGAQVKVVMTESALKFITPLTFQAITHEPVATTLVDYEQETAMGHIELAQWADVILIAPATANIVAQLTYGLAADLLSCLCLATQAPIILAPAMNQAMYRKPIIQSNLDHLKNNGFYIIEPATGPQACGDFGPGRLPEPLEIAQHLESILRSKRLNGQHFLMTAGPTREALDSVRFLTNKSSGKMGVSLARAAYLAGAKVTLVCGPLQTEIPSAGSDPNFSVIHVESAQEMFNACESTKDYTLFIGCAAVADLRPAHPNQQKLKKHQIGRSIECIENPDIIATLAQQNPNSIHIGFAAETHNIAAYALEKLKKKNIDLMITNDVSKASIGFNSDYNQVNFLINEDKWPQAQRVTTPKEPLLKTQLAPTLISYIEQLFIKKQSLP